MLSVVDATEFCSLHRTKPFTFSTSDTLSREHLHGKKNHCKSRELAAFQVFKFAPLAVSFMEIDSLIHVSEGLERVCGKYPLEEHRRTKERGRTAAYTW